MKSKKLKQNNKNLNPNLKLFKIIRKSDGHLMRLWPHLERGYCCDYSLEFELEESGLIPCILYLTQGEYDSFYDRDAFSYGSIWMSGLDTSLQINPEEYQLIEIIEGSI